MATPIPPPRPQEQAPEQSVSACEPYGEFIQEQFELRRHYTAIDQDLVGICQFSGAHNNAKRFAGRLFESDPFLY